MRIANFTGVQGGHGDLIEGDKYVGKIGVRPIDIKGIGRVYGVSIELGEKRQDKVEYWTRLGLSSHFGVGRQAFAIGFTA